MMQRYKLQLCCMLYIKNVAAPLQICRQFVDTLRYFQSNIIVHDWMQSNTNTSVSAFAWLCFIQVCVCSWEFDMICRFQIIWSCGMYTWTLRTDICSHGIRLSLHLNTIANSPFLRCWSQPQTLSAMATWWRSCCLCNALYYSLVTLEWEK